MEQNRLWREPVVQIYANAISPGVSCSAAAYDLANRRWYKLNVSDTASSSVGTFEVPDDDWLSSTVERHVSHVYKSTGSPPTWNIINTTSTGQPFTFEEAKENDSIGMPITERFFYGHVLSDLLPTIQFRDLQNKAYLSRGADYCDWEGEKCVFKRIEFDCDNESHEHEIRAREKLIRHINQESSFTPLNVNHEMMARFNVVPILGVVLHDETSSWMVREPMKFADDEVEDEEKFEEEDEDESKPQEASVLTESGEPGKQSHTVAGFITPYMGRSLELFGAVNPNQDVTSSEEQAPSMPANRCLTTTADMPITMHQLLDLVKGVKELSACGVTHGDICYWNIVLEESEPRFASSAAPRLLLIDMGDTAPDYENDAVALADVLLWCLKHSSRLREDEAFRKIVIVASASLKEVDFDGAIGLLSPASVFEDEDTAKVSYSHIAQRAKRRRS